METNKIYDLLGIGIGPFNLSLATMLQDHPQINALFIDQKDTFDWHPGLNLPWARLQVPYLADMITLANPKSKFTFLNYLHETGNLFRFCAQENIFPLRIEYNNYCKWVVAELQNLKFSQRCENITYDEKEEIYTIQTSNYSCNKTFHAKRLVIGIGTQPYIPEAISLTGENNIVHSSGYLSHKSQILNSKKVTIVGSGQSAAEIYYDLLQQADNFTNLDWFTRSRNIAPMDYSRFALEMATPDYVEYFYNLPMRAKKEVLANQNYLYKGINQELIKQIHDSLHILHTSCHPCTTRVYTSMKLREAVKENQNLQMTFHHRDTHNSINHQTNFLVLATGYDQKPPAFLKGINKKINCLNDHKYDVSNNYTIDDRQSIFVQNADLHSHGFNSADLGLAQYRNMVILNSILGREAYRIETNTTFQSFGPPPPNDMSKSLKGESL